MVQGQGGLILWKGTALRRQKRMPGGRADTPGLNQTIPAREQGFHVEVDAPWACLGGSRWIHALPGCIPLSASAEDGLAELFSNNGEDHLETVVAGNGRPDAVARPVPNRLGQWLLQGEEFPRPDPCRESGGGPAATKATPP